MRTFALLPLLLAACASPGMRYRLDPGESFTIVGVVEKEILQKDARVQKMEIRFALECEVTRAEPDDNVAIDCALSRIAVRGETRGKPFAYDSSLASEPKDAVAQRYRAALGERFEVVKSLYGPIRSVKGGRAIEAAMGVPVQTVLAWFGGSFPRHRARPGDRWDESERMTMTPEFIGLPLPIAEEIAMRTGYTYQGRRGPRPLIAVHTTYRSAHVDGEGEGMMLYDPPSGKIYLSKRSATIRVGQIEVRLRAAAAHSEEALGDAP